MDSDLFQKKFNSDKLNQSWLNTIILGIRNYDQMAKIIFKHK